MKRALLGGRESKIDILGYFMQQLAYSGYH
jgi:hypothetical protein